LGDAYDSGLAAGMVDKDAVAGMHRFDRLQRLRVLDAVPNCGTVALKIGDGVDDWLGLGKKVVHRCILLNLNGLAVTGELEYVLTELEYNKKECFRSGIAPEAWG
jgi:hypothetical protein